MLTLPIKKKWFDMILSGEKKEEYRDQTPYWLNRLYSEIGRQHEGDKRTMTTREPFWVCFRNGYSPDSPTFEARSLSRQATESSNGVLRRTSGTSY